MDRKAQAGFVGIILATIGILIGLALFSGISPSIGQMTRTFDTVNVTMTLPAANATSELTMCGQRAISNTVTNATGGETIPATNYTISQSAGTDGYLAAKVTTHSTSKYASKSVNVTCNYEPKGYVSDGGSRGIVTIIAIFFAILILVTALPNVRDGVMDFFRGR